MRSFGAGNALGQRQRAPGRTAAAVRGARKALSAEFQVGSSTPELTDGAAFDERRVLGPWLSRIFCDKIA
jgi:hypothetical protein